MSSRPKNSCVNEIIFYWHIVVFVKFDESDAIGIAKIEKFVGIFFWKPSRDKTRQLGIT